MKADDLKKFELPATIFLTTGFIGTDHVVKQSDVLLSSDMLTWEEIRCMTKDRITFGAHSITHPRINRLDYAGQKKRKLRVV